MTLCECGCGKPANRRFIKGHNAKLIRQSRETIEGRSGNKHPLWLGDDVSYKGLHTYVRKYKKRKNRCELCGKKGQTEFHSIGHKYIRDLDDWMELCQPCHTLENRKC